MVGLGDKVSPTDIEEGMRVGYVTLLFCLYSFGLKFISFGLNVNTSPYAHIFFVCCYHPFMRLTSKVP